MKPEQWAEVTWGFVEPGDFVKGMKSETVFRVDRKSEDLDLAGKYGFVLYAPSLGAASGERDPGKPCRVRIVHNGERTAAGRRDDGLTDEGEKALKRLLDAEIIAHRDMTGKTFKPYVLPRRFTAPDLASHLFLFHKLYTGDIKSKDGIELRKAHKAFHDADMTTQPETARRIPHVHDERAFQEGL